MSRRTGLLIWLGLCFWSVETLIAGLHHRWPAALAGALLAVVAIVALIRVQNRRTQRQAGPWPTALFLSVVGVGLAAAGAWNLDTLVNAAHHDALQEVASGVLFSLGLATAVSGAYSTWIWSGPVETTRP